MMCGQEMENFHVFPIKSIGTIIVCGTNINNPRNAKKMWYKCATVKCNEFSNIRYGYTFNIEVGFPFSYEEKESGRVPKEMDLINFYWNLSTDQSIETLRELLVKTLLFDFQGDANYE